VANDTISRTPSRLRKFSVFPFAVLWVVLIVALLAWKGSVYSEAAQVRQFLGMQETTAASIWWTGAGCAVACLLAIVAFTLLRRKRARESTCHKGQFMPRRSTS
jgi:uncharacterized membrane protein SirB2